MAIIKKKIWPEYYDSVSSGKRKYDLRLQDFDIKEGDTLVLEEWDQKTKKYTGRKIEKKVTHVSKFRIDDDKWWPEDEIIDKGLQIISIE